jgi:hypothetical protein
MVGDYINLSSGYYIECIIYRCLNNILLVSSLYLFSSLFGGMVFGDF